MDHLHYRLNFGLDKNFITTWKSITKLVIFRSFVVKCCKMRIMYSLAKFAIFSHFVLQTGNWCPNTRLGCLFPVRNTKWLKNGKLPRAISSAFYNISQRNFGILLILWCSFKLWWNFCLDPNLVYNANGPFSQSKNFLVLIAVKKSAIIEIDS
jgi:hypothetical protein